MNQQIPGKLQILKVLAITVVSGIIMVISIKNDFKYFVICDSVLV